MRGKVRVVGKSELGIVDGVSNDRKTDEKGRGKEESGAVVWVQLQKFCLL